MNAKLLFAISVIAIFFCANTSAQTTEFTYQGSLTSSGSPANGSHDLEFALFDSAGGAGQVGPTLTRNGVIVSNGIFSVSLDFGAVFTGAARFLEIRVRPSGGGSFTPLSPRQAIASTPYAIKSLTADSATTATNATQLGGVPASSYLQTVSRNSTLSGNGTTASPLGVAVPLNLAGSDSFGLVFANNSAAGSGIVGFSSSGTGVRGQGGSANPGTGVFGVGFYGVEGATFASGPTRAIGVYGRAGSATGDTSGVEGESASSSGAGVFGIATSTSGSTYGVRGQANSPSGHGVLGAAIATTGSGIGVRGFSNSPDGSGVVGSNNAGGFAGFFVGKSYFSGPVGIGTTNPIYSLDVNGGLNSFRAKTGSTSGSDAVATFENGAGIVAMIRGNGNVGIGTANPVEKLHVINNTINSSALFENNGPGQAVRGVSPSGIGIIGSGTRGGSFSGSSIAVEATGSGGRSTYLGGGGSTGSEIKFLYEGNAHYSIYNSGNSRLTIANTSDNFLPNTPGFPLLTVSSTGTLFIRDYVSGQNLAVCTTNTGGNSNLVGLCSSSLRYKTNVRTFRRGLEIISRLRPISFDWKEAHTHDIGLAAEEVERVDPELTFKNDRGEVEGVKYNQLSAVFINAFKEQQIQIEAQRAENARLSKKIDSQQREIDALKALVCEDKKIAAICRKEQ